MEATRVLIPASTSHGLISLARVKAYLEETGATRDALLTQLITDATAAMVEWLGVHPGRQRYQVDSCGDGCCRRTLARLPAEEGSLAVMIDGTAVTDWTLEDPEGGIVYRESGWTWPASSALNLRDTFYAGYLLPDQVATWAASTAKTAGAFARPSAVSVLRYECTVAGTTGATEPAWPATIGATVTDGTATWTARAARELPEFVQKLCYAEVLRLDGERSRPAGLASWSMDGAAESYFRDHTGGALGPSVERGLYGFRASLGVHGAC